MKKYPYIIQRALPYYCVNFGIDISKRLFDKVVIFDNEKNKDLKFTMNYDDIYGMQLFLGGKKSRYEDLHSKELKDIDKFFNSYLQYIKKKNTASREFPLKIT